MDRAEVETNLIVSRQKPVGTSAIRHSGDWLAALLIASCGLIRLDVDDEAIRVAVALRLGLDLIRVPHVCRCGSQVDAWGLHTLVCKHTPSRISSHHALNDIISRAFSSAGIPAIKEPT